MSRTAAGQIHFCFVHVDHVVIILLYSPSTHHVSKELLYVATNTFARQREQCRTSLVGSYLNGVWRWLSRDMRERIRGTSRWYTLPKHFARDMLLWNSGLRWGWSSSWNQVFLRWRDWFSRMEVRGRNLPSLPTSFCWLAVLLAAEVLTTQTILRVLWLEFPGAQTLCVQIDLEWRYGTEEWCVFDDIVVTILRIFVEDTDPLRFWYCTVVVSVVAPPSLLNVNSGLGSTYGHC